MVFIFIILGAVILGSLFESFQFALLGAFLGFLLNKVIQLSNKVTQLTFSLQKLKNEQREAEQTLEESQLRSSQLRPSQLRPSQVGQTQPIADPAPLDSIIKGADDEFQTKEANLSNSDKNGSPSTAQQPVYKTGPASNQIESTPIKSIEKEPVKATQQPAKPVTRKVAPPANDIISRGIDFVTRYFTEGNVVVRVGAVVLFFGIAFLLKYAAENSDIPMEFRLTGVAIGAVVLLIFGWRLRDKQQGYGLILQGAAIGILYLTLFAGFRLYQLVPPGLSFILLILFSAFAMALAVLQDSRALAVLSVMGGFLAPVLTSTGSGSHVGLFSYYSILNIGIFAVAWFKSWRMLNIVGFVFTFVIGTAWGIERYQAEHFSTTEPFLILFFLLYSAIALLFATRQKPSLKGYLDGTLVFGLPIIGFSLQAAMVQDIEFGLAWSSFALGAFYLMSAFAVLRGKNEHLKVIAEAYLALGMIFVSLVIPFALDGEWTAASWAIEGAGLIWLGLRQERWFAKYLGALIQFIGGLIFLAEYDLNSDYGSGFSAEVLGVFSVAIAAIFSSYQIWQRRGSLIPREAASYLAFLIWGLLWWYLGGMAQINAHIETADQIVGLVLFISLSSILFYLLERYLPWYSLRQITWVGLVFTILLAIGNFELHSHLFDSWPSVVWAFAIASFYAILFAREKNILSGLDKTHKLSLENTSFTDAFKLPAANSGLHITALVAMIFLSINEFAWLPAEFEFAHTSWAVGLMGLLLTGWVLLLGKNNLWPIKVHSNSYSKVGMMIILVGVFFWIFWNFSNSGNASPLPYIPLLNPLDIVLAILVVAVVKSTNKLSSLDISIDPALLKNASIIFVFIWLNILLFRSIHAWFAVPYDVDELMRSFLVQTSLSIFWTIIGLAGTVYAARKINRKIWIYSAGLIGVVVVKLFTVDLEHSSSIERIISFVVVGLLLLIVGYFSPLPPKQEALKVANKDDNKVKDEV